MKEPKLRFPEFTGDWEQRKFEDVVTIGSGKDYKHLESGNVPVYGTGGYMLSVNQALSENEDAVGIGRKGTIDKPYILRAPFWTVDTLFYCIPNKGFDLTFTNCLFQNVDWKKKDESTGVPSLSKVIINNVKTYVPSLAEQQKIASLFTELDTLIQSAEKELEGYRELKRGMLQKMFPKKGEKVPEIRFPEFSGDWKQCKLGDMAYSFEYGLNVAAKEFDGKNKYLRITDIDDSTHEFLTNSLTSPDVDLTGAEKYKLNKGDILFARTGASVGKSYIYRESDGLVYYAGFLIRARIKEQYNVEFVFQNTLTERYNNFIAVTSQRSGQPGVNAQEYSEFEIQVPRKEEQDKIGTFFTNLDNLIASQQQELDGYKELKKGLLQQMFC